MQVKADFAGDIQRVSHQNSRAEGEIVLALICELGRRDHFSLLRRGNADSGNHKKKSWKVDSCVALVASSHTLSISDFCGGDLPHASASSSLSICTFLASYVDLRA